MKKIIFLIPVLSFIGCASAPKHLHAQGSVVALDSANEGHVCMNATSVEIGEKLSLAETTCKLSKTTANGKYSDEVSVNVCSKTAKGTVEVMGMADPHFIKVKSVSGVNLREGDVVEKIVQ